MLPLPALLWHAAEYCDRIGVILEDGFRREFRVMKLDFGDILDNPEVRYYLRQALWWLLKTAIQSRGSFERFMEKVDALSSVIDLTWSDPRKNAVWTFIGCAPYEKNPT